MRKWVYQVNHEYFVIEAETLHDAMLDAAGCGGVVIGEYTQYVHMFKE